jgi:Leucine-rich repeat (LRR) protein
MSEVRNVLLLLSLVLIGCVSGQEEKQIIRHLNATLPVKYKISFLNEGGCSLELDYSGISDLGPLKGLPIKALSISNCKVTDLRPLEGMPLRFLNASANENLTDLSPLTNCPIEILLLGCLEKISDLTPLKKMPLRELCLLGSKDIDLTPLRDTPLRELDLGFHSNITNLSALRGMHLTSLDISQTDISDLTPLINMPLVKLDAFETKVVDISSLRGMPLKELSLPCPVKSLEPLKGMPLTNLCLCCEGNTPIAGLDFLESLPDGITINELGLDDTKITDLSPLKDLKVISLYFDDKKVTKGLDVIRKMTSLVFINGVEAKVFWESYDSGFRQ